MTNQQPQSTSVDRVTIESDRRPPGLIASVVVGVGLLAVLFWQFAGVADDGMQFQVLDPDLHLMWKAVIVVTVGASTACSLVAWVRRTWTMSVAVINAAANWMGSAVIIVLTVQGALFAPMLPTQIGTTFETTTDWSGLAEPFLVLVACIAIWDSVDGILRAHSSRAT